MKNFGYIGHYPEPDHSDTKADENPDILSNKAEHPPPDLHHFFEFGRTSHYILHMQQEDIEYNNHRWFNHFSKESEEFSTVNIYDHIHPEDLPFYLECESKSHTFFKELSQKDLRNYKTRFDFRVGINGFYKRYLQQRVLLEHENESNRSFLIIMTDISHLKRSSSNHYSITRINKIECSDPNHAPYIKVEDPFPLTRREKDVYGYLMQSLKTREIAIKLFVSEETIKNHRKRILKKTGCKNTLGLIMTSFENGWI